MKPGLITGDNRSGGAKSTEKEIYIVLCASGFEDPARVRSALMFATLAASADLRAVLYCIQNAVDVMVKDAAHKKEQPPGRGPTISGRLAEAMEHGVEIQCCTQTMANKGIQEEDLMEGVKPAGAMNLISLTTRAKGTISF